MSKNQQLLAAALVGAMAPDSDIATPSRARAFSFASAVAAINVGDMPAARVIKIDSEQSIEQANATITAESDKLRASIGSSVNQAKRRNPGAEYSVEMMPMLFKSGLYIVALVHRVA